jgi:hypothetical protein
LAIGVELLEALAGVGGADALPGAVRAEAGAIVADLKDELAVFAAGAEVDFAGLGVGFDAVADRVLDDGLEDEVRDFGVQGVFGNVHRDGEAVAETGLFDFEVALEEGDFVAERDDMFVGVVQGVAEEIAEFGDHAIGFFDVDVHEGADAVEGVEEEVRIELGLEGDEFGLGEAAFEFGGFEVVFAEFAVVLDGVADGEDDPVNPEVEVKGSCEKINEHAAEIRRVAVDVEFDLGNCGTQNNPKTREKNAGEEMKQAGRKPVALVELKAAREPQNRQGEEGARIPVAERAKNGFAPRIFLGEVGIDGERECDGRPKKNENGPAKSFLSDDWAIHSAQLRFCEVIKTALMGENNEESSKRAGPGVAGRARFEH